MCSSSQMVVDGAACRGESRGQRAAVCVVTPTSLSCRVPPRAREGWEGRRPLSDPAEAVDGVEVLGALLLVADAEAFLGGEGEDADLALVGVVVDVVGGLADVVHRVDPGQ